MARIVLGIFPFSFESFQSFWEKNGEESKIVKVAKQGDFGGMSLSIVWGLFCGRSLTSLLYNQTEIYWKSLKKPAANPKPRMSIFTVWKTVKPHTEAVLWYKIGVKHVLFPIMIANVK